MDRDLQAALAAALGSPVARSRPLSGGDINRACALELDDGRRLFVKYNQQADPAMFAREARGLEWLREARALTIPEVVAVSERPAFLVLELMESGPQLRDFDQQLGHGLAELHRFGAPRFGLDHDNFIGRLPQSNQPSASWVEFYRERRLRPQLELAQRSGHATPGMQRGFDRLFDRLDELLGPAEPPARLHGDLWGGNLHVAASGEPVLIDPAAYAGHREIDLAMMKLFGGFDARVFDAYSEAYPLAAGHAERVALYQLYPLMVHVNLFGAGYAGSVARILARY